MRSKQVVEIQPIAPVIDRKGRLHSWGGIKMRWPGARWEWAAKVFERLFDCDACPAVPEGRKKWKARDQKIEWGDSSFVFGCRYCDRSNLEPDTATPCQKVESGLVRITITPEPDEIKIEGIGDE